jgi:hypothetical protein
MACLMPICMYIKFDIVNARLELVVNGVVKPPARLQQMPNFQQYQQDLARIRNAYATTPIHQQCDPHCHCAKVNNRPLARNVPVPPQVIDQGTLPNGQAWVVHVTGVTMTLWLSHCVPDGARVWDGHGWKPAESWGPGWEAPPMDHGGPLSTGGGSSGGKKKKGGKKSKRGKKPIRRQVRKLRR